jgi:hypothetical protein
VHQRDREREDNLKFECGRCAYCRGVNIVILNWLRPLLEGDQEVVKRSGRDEPVWVVIHKCMEATLGLSLYSYLFQSSKNAISFLLSLMFSLQQSWRKSEQNRFCIEAGCVGREMYTCVIKCSNSTKKIVA